VEKILLSGARQKLDKKQKTATKTEENQQPATRRKHTTDASTSTPLHTMTKSRREVQIWATVICCSFFVVLLCMSVTIVPVGHVAVIDLFGSVYDSPLQSGFHLVNPLASVRALNVKTQLLGLRAEVPSKEGLVVDFEMGVLYHLDPEMAVQVYKTIGVDYAEVVLSPQLRSAVRHLTSGFEAKALYTADSREAMSISNW